MLVACSGTDHEPQLADQAPRLVERGSGDGDPALADGGLEGPYEVGFRFLALVDPGRDVASGGRRIPLHLWYPVDPEAVGPSTARASYPLDPLHDALPHVSSATFEALGIDGALAAPRPSSRGPFPLVMFSPGWGLDANTYLFLGTRLASHGYVVAVPTHQGDGYGGLPVSMVDTFDHIAQAMFNRPRDLSFALTRLLEANRTRGDPLHRLIQPNRVAASGHSLGGYAALVLGGAGDDAICDSVAVDSEWMGPPPQEFCASSRPDHRFRALFHLDAANQYLQFAELQRIELPTQGVGQDPISLNALPPPWGSWQARVHAAIAHPHAYRADLEHAIHLSFANVCQLFPVWLEHGVVPLDTYDFVMPLLCGPTTPILADQPLLPSLEAQRLVSRMLLPFLKTHLENDERYARMLDARWVNEREENVAFFDTERGGDTHEGPGAPYLDPTWTDEFDYYLYPPAGR